ncbi:MAG: hypothetical protein V4547_13605 [Bacteroidota bacterium]
MNNVTEYYIVPKHIYEATKKDPVPQETRFGDIPASARKKVFDLVSWLEINNIKVSDSVVAYAVRGRFRPVDWLENVHSLLQVPSHLLSLRVYKEIKRLRLRGKKKQP